MLLVTWALQGARAWRCRWVGCGLCTPEAPRLSPGCAGEQARPKGGAGGETVERGQEPAHSYSCRSSCGFPMRPSLSLLHAGKGAAVGSMRKLTAPRNKRGYETAVLLPSLTHVLQFPPRGRQAFPFGEEDFGLPSEKEKQIKRSFCKRTAVASLQRAPNLRPQHLSPACTRLRPRGS